METTPTGIFKNENMSLEIVTAPKDMSDIINANAQPGQPYMAPTNLMTWFNRMSSGGIGKCKLTAGNQVINADCTYAKNILTLTDSSGQTYFCFMFGKLYMLDPDGNNTIVLSK